MKRLGKRGREWSKIRASLKKEFFAKNIVRCEMCTSGFNLSFAHRLKRRFITDEQELRTVALLCLSCHSRIEVSGHSAMFKAITNIIQQRENQ